MSCKGNRSLIGQGHQACTSSCRTDQQLCLQLVRRASVCRLPGTGFWKRCTCCAAGSAPIRTTASCSTAALQTISAAAAVCCLDHRQHPHSASSCSKECQAGCAICLSRMSNMPQAGCAICLKQDLQPASRQGRALLHVGWQSFPPVLLSPRQVPPVVVPDVGGARHAGCRPGS